MQPAHRPDDFPLRVSPNGVQGSGLVQAVPGPRGKHHIHDPDPEVVIVDPRNITQINRAEEDGDADALQRLEPMINSGLMLEVFHKDGDCAFADKGVAVCEQRDLEYDFLGPLLPDANHPAVQCAPKLLAEKSEPLGMVDGMTDAIALASVESGIGAPLIKQTSSYQS